MKVDTDLVVACVEHICATKEEGAILVFMPGWDGIADVCRKLSERNCPTMNPGNNLPAMTVGEIPSGRV